MTDGESKHVFVSYVRGDSDEVDNLCAVLEAAGISYWRDRKDLGPGDAWKAKIKGAIQDGSLVFVACFSDNSRAKEKSYMNEELTLAVDEFRQMPPGRVWLIPVRFDDGQVPDWDLGAGRVLSDLNFADLFGASYAANAARLVTTVNRLLGEKRLDSATALAAVEQATDANRVELLKRLTKEMLLEPSRRIELDDLVSQEVQRVAVMLRDQDLVAGPLGGTPEQQLVDIVERTEATWRLVQPFCASLQVASRWGAPESMDPWATGLRTFVAAALKPESGVRALISMRHLPGVVSIFTAALACQGSNNWANLKALVVDPSVRDRHDQKLRPIIDATDPYAPFEGAGDFVTHTLAHASIAGLDAADALKDFIDSKMGRYHTPVAEWLHHVLRPMFREQFPDDEAYDAAFDRTEVLLGVLAQDVVSQRSAANGGYGGYVRWFGRSTWRAASWQGRGTALDDLIDDSNGQGAQWPPLVAGLFGGDLGRAREAVHDYKQRFDQIVHQRSFM